MKKLLSVFYYLSFSILFCTAQKKEFNYGQVFGDIPAHISKSLPGITRWLDDDHYLERKDEGGKTVFVSVEAKTGNAVSYESPDTKIGAREDIPADAVNVEHSPDGRWVAYTKANNLFARELSTGKEIQFTHDGSQDIYNGYAAWVYYEEILHRNGHYQAFWWSPDSRHIAFIHFDEREVPVFPIYHSEGLHGFLENRHYPQAGDKNPKVKMGFVSVDDPRTVWAGFNENDDQYFHSPYWVPDGSSLWVQWMPRTQREIKIVAVDIHTGATKEVYDEKQGTWVTEKYISFLENGKQFILSSDKTGWNHLYLYKMNGELVNQVTQGDFSVTWIAHIDEKNMIIYFLARKENSARIDFYKIGFDGRGLTRLSFGDYTHDEINLSPHAKYFITTYSNISTPPKMALVDTKGKLIRELGDSKGDEFDRYDWAKTELRRVKSRDSLFDLPVRITYPLHFDPGKKYPVLIEVYGGPDLGKVYDRWSPDLREQWWAKEGMIQVWIDDRASGHFGKAGMNYIYRQLGKYETEDFMDCGRWLRQQSFVDTTRVCITGFSFGGYITCMALTYGADVFTHGLAYYPVTDWRLYDTYYAEKFMGTPQDNPDGYAITSALTYAKNYKGLLRIVHGTTDDNVHMQNTLQFINELEDLDRHFEMMIYPGERHGRSHWSSEKKKHSYNEDFTFFYNNLLNKRMPAFFRE